MEMPRKDEDDPITINPYVLRTECRDVHDKINGALWGWDGRGGIVKDIGDIKNFMETFREAHKDEKGEKQDRFRAWRTLAYSIIGGCVVAGFAYLIRVL